MEKYSSKEYSSAAYILLMYRLMFWATILLGSETRQGEGAAAVISATEPQGCVDPALTPDWLLQLLVAGTSCLEEYESDLR